jgi:cell division protein FtsB
MQGVRRSAVDDRPFGLGIDALLARAFDFPRRMKWQSWLVIVGLGLAVYFCYHAVNGSRGYWAFQEREQELLTVERKLAVLQDERRRLERRVERLRPESLDPDLIDELARDMLSMAEADDVIILLDPPPIPSEIGDR